ncbi:MAG: DUF1667 domain-containing protein [Clostridia bacterium]
MANKFPIQTVCIVCPKGCNLTINKHGKNVIVSGNFCARGEIYGKSEVQNPTRVVTATITTKTQVINVKTTIPVPKNKIFNVLKELEKIKDKPYKYGEKIIENVLGLCADFVVTNVNNI